MDLIFETEGTFTQDDKSWLASRDGLTVARSVTLDFALFTAATHYPNGYIPAGIALGLVTATGRYGPYLAAAGDGRSTFRGFLLSELRVRTSNTTGKGAGALYWKGIIRQSRLPANHGLDAAAIAAYTNIRFEA